MMGYDPDFLGSEINLPLPEFSPAIVGNVLNKPELRDGIYADYVNFTIVMNRIRRSPIVAALNIDQNLLKNVPRKRDWSLDTRVGAEFQLDNDYYQERRWQRGHLARRASAAWGETSREAKKASDATFFYPNATLQHENFNPDEWLALENWVKDLTLDNNDRITEFTGPIYGEFGRIVAPVGREPAESPSGFFKVICYIGRDRQLAVRAFIMYQDLDAIADPFGKRLFNFQRYQVTISEIEALTGLDFDDRIYEQNPLFFNENETARQELNIQNFPEQIPVDEPLEMIAEGEVRDTITQSESSVVIAAAMVNPTGNERQNEWISLVNFSASEVDLNGWTLSDDKRESLQISKAIASNRRILRSGESIRIQPVEPLMLDNKGGTISLFESPNNGTKRGRRIDRVRYTGQQASMEGVPIIFNDLF
jgi:endonuclease G